MSVLIIEETKMLSLLVMAVYLIVPGILEYFDVTS